jgi:DNA-binding MarR family transcriptional regulator
VPGKLQQEIQQTKPFDSVEEEAILNIVRTAELLQGVIADFLKGFDLSPVQYNVLRILRGAGVAGATCSQIGERLLSRDPDITRLLDRMESRGLIVRERSSEDRRVVITRISPTGLALTDSIDHPLRETGKSMLRGFEQEELAKLITELERMRESLGTAAEELQERKNK